MNHIVDLTDSIVYIAKQFYPHVELIILVYFDTDTKFAQNLSLGM